MSRTPVVAGLAATAAAGLVWATWPAAGRLTFRAAAAADARAAGLRRRTVTVDGLPVTVLEGGDAAGATVLLLHGYTADGTVWSRFAQHLVDRYRVVVPDLAGHGLTPYAAGAGYGAPAQADRVARLMDEIGVRGAHVMGNSMGGFVAAQLALRHPDKVRSLCLSDAAGVTTPTPSDAEVMLQQGRNPFLIEHPSQFAEFYAMTMKRPPFAPGFVLAALAADYTDRRASYAEIFEDFYQRDFVDDRLTEIAVPTLIVWGSHDRLVHPSAVEVWTRIPGSRAVVYDDLGHMPMVEAPRRVARDYAGFLAGLAGGTGA